MSTVYLIPKPADRLQKRNREAGWRNVPIDREGQKELTQRVEPLKDKGITAIFSSDLDSPSAKCVGDQLHVPNIRAEFNLRRFNVGRHHAADRHHVDIILGELQEKWKVNKAIPIRGGDSLVSFEKRFVKRWTQLLESEGVFAMIVDVRTLSVIRDMAKNVYSAASLAPNGNSPAMDRIYKVEKPCL